jgi:hypothetical protein
MVNAIVKNTQPSGKIVTPSSHNAPIMPFKPPDELPNHLDITKHIEDKNGITNIHIHSIGHDNHAIEFIGSKDHIDHTQWPITKDMATFIANNNNLNSKFQPIVIPYSSACYMCNEFKRKNVKKIFLIVFIIICVIIVVCLIIYFVDKGKTVNEDKKNTHSGKHKRSGGKHHGGKHKHSGEHNSGNGEHNIGNDDHNIGNDEHNIGNDEHNIGNEHNNFLYK